MILRSLYIKLNILSNDIIIFCDFMFVVYVLHKWTSKILPEKNILFREQGPSKF